MAAPAQQRRDAGLTIYYSGQLCQVVSCVQALTAVRQENGLRLSAALRFAADFEGDDSGLQYYEQALLEGRVVVVHIFPPEHAESDFLH